MAQSLDDLFRKYYLEYTSYVVKDRAIPYVEDGFKPVQRRIIQTLIDLDNGMMHKVSRVVGETMKYHPHGDASIYEALVNLVNAKYFIQGGGNFGNTLTGTEAAAGRYIECRLLPFAKEVLYSPGIMSYVPTYDSRYKEPVVFPSKLPVVLLMGVTGIAPGMICKIFPHNPIEVIEAMKKAIDGEDFALFPDLPTGGLVDVSEYDDGKGAISIRSRVEIDKAARKLIVREIPYTVTTESLIESIDQAAKKGKLHVQSINDYTTDKANIEIEIAKGDFTLEDELESLYAHTNAELKVRDLTPMIIVDKHPVLMGVSEIIRFHASYLQDLLRRELELEKGNLLAKLQLRTLERIFIEERIYKKIELLKTEEEINEAVRKGLMRFRSEFVKELEQCDIDHLLKLPIRRISLFDIEKNKKDIEEINKAIDENEDRLKHISKHAKSTLDRLRKLIPREIDTSRKSEIASFTVVSAKDARRTDLLLRYDKDSGYLGYGLKSGDALFKVSEADKILIVFKDGAYRVEAAQDKGFVGKNAAFVFPADKETLKGIVFTLVFRNNLTKALMIKRCSVSQFIMNKPYSMVPEGDYEVKFICADEEGMFTFEYRNSKSGSGGKAYLSDFPVKGVASQGMRFSKREVKGMKYKRMKAGDRPTAAGDPDLFSSG